LKQKQLFSWAIVIFLLLVTMISGGCGRNGCSSEGSRGKIKLAWDPSPDPNVAGYKLCYGTVSKTYEYSIDVGKVTTYTLDGLTKGQRVYIAITAYSKQKKKAPFQTR